MSPAKLLANLWQGGYPRIPSKNLEKREEGGIWSTDAVQSTFCLQLYHSLSYYVHST